MSRMSFPDEVGCSSQMKSTWPSVLTGRSSVVYRVQSRFRLAQMDRPPAGSCAPASTPRPARRVLADGGTSRSWTYASVHRRRWPSPLTASSSVTATSVTSSSGGRVHGNPVSLPTSPLPRDRCCPRTSTTRSSPAATRRTDAPRLVRVTSPDLSGAGPLTPSNGAGYPPGRGTVGKAPPWWTRWACTVSRSSRVGRPSCCGRGTTGSAPPQQVGRRPDHGHRLLRQLAAAGLADGRHGHVGGQGDVGDGGASGS